MTQCLVVAVGIDVGTSFVKAMALDGVTVSDFARAPLPSPELASDLWRALEDVFEAFLPGAQRRSVGAICVSGRAPTLVGIRDDQRDGPILGWDSPGTPAGTGFYLDSIARSLMESDRDLYDSCRFFVNPHEYLTYVLSGLVRSSTPSGLYHPWGGYVTEATRRIRQARVDLSKVPPVVAVGSIVGRISPASASSLGLNESTKVVMGGWDFLADVLGSGLNASGEVLVRAGTSMAVDALWSSPISVNGFFTTPHFMPGTYVVGKIVEAATWRVKPEELDHGPMAQKPPRVRDTVLEIVGAISRLRATIGEPPSIVCSGQRALSTDLCRTLAKTITRPVERVDTPSAEAQGTAVLASVAAGLTSNHGEHVRAIRSNWEEIKAE